VFFETRPDGYERWRCRDPDGTHRAVYVHQLAAVADGADPKEVFSNGTFQVHHQDGIGWNNDPANLEVIDAYSHGHRHVGD